MNIFRLTAVSYDIYYTNILKVYLYRDNCNFKNINNLKKIKHYSFDIKIL